MNSVCMPEDCAKQWEILLLLLSSEEKKIDRTNDSEIDTMNYFCNNEGIRKILLEWLEQMKKTYATKTCESDTATKCDEVSLLWRQRGNDKFRANLIDDSYQCYTKSVIYADQEGTMYPLALANRSAALLRLKRYKECLSDITLAIDGGYPLEQRHKLLLRRADCYIELGDREMAQDSLRTAIEHASKLEMSPTHAGEFDRHAKLVEKKLEVVVETVPDDDDELPSLYKGDNPNFQAASNAIELRRSESAGRYVATVEAVRRGDVLFSEEPYAWVALPGDLTVCETCCTARCNCVPCEMCSRSLYCGLSCRARASQSFHCWECVGAQMALFPTIGIAHLALRVLLITASAGFPRTPANKTPRSAADLFAGYSAVNPVQIYVKDTPPFYRMFNLVTNFDKMNNTDYVQYALTATLLTLYLETYTTFFEYLPSKVPYTLSDNQLRLFSAALMLRSLGQLVCNGHAALSLETVIEDDCKEGRTLTEREVRRATAIYPSAAMMNHSCDPNIINTFHNSRLIIRCARELPPGAEVLNCYGPHRARATTTHRRQQLRAQYMFNCNCGACVDTAHKDFVLLFTAYACQSCKGPVVWGGLAHCQQCRTEFDLQRALNVIDRADELTAQAEQAPTLELRCEKAHAALRLKQQVWHRHHTALRNTADGLARLYADNGEYTKSMELIKQNIQSLEYQFGSFSVEVAHELRKLADVMLERIINSPHNVDYRDWCLETHKIIKKAVQLMELNYGSWEPLVKRLRGQEALVAAHLAESRTPDAGDSVHHNLHYNLKI